MLCNFYFFIVHIWAWNFLGYVSCTEDTVFTTFLIDLDFFLQWPHNFQPSMGTQVEKWCSSTQKIHCILPSLCLLMNVTFYLLIYYSSIRLFIFCTCMHFILALVGIFSMRNLGRFLPEESQLWESSATQPNKLLMLVEFVQNLARMFFHLVWWVL